MGCLEERYFILLAVKDEEEVVFLIWKAPQRKQIHLNERIIL